MDITKAFLEFLDPIPFAHIAAVGIAAALATFNQAQKGWFDFLSKRLAHGDKKREPLLKLLEKGKLETVNATVLQAHAKRAYGVQLPTHVLRHVLTRDDPEIVTQFAFSAKSLIRLEIETEKFGYIEGKKPWEHLEAFYTFVAVISGLIGCLCCVYAAGVKELLPIGFAADFFAIAWIITNKSGALYAAKYLIENSPLPLGEPQKCKAAHPVALQMESPKPSASPSSGAEKIAASTEASVAGEPGMRQRKTTARKTAKNSETRPM